MTLAERFDQLNLSRQMIRIVRTNAMQLIHQFLRDALGLGIVHAVHHPVTTAFTDAKPIFSSSQSIRKAAADR